MRSEEQRFLRNLLENSEVGCTRDMLRKLAFDMISRTQFNGLKHKFETDYFKPSEVIFELITMWISFKGNEATLINFEKILRDHQLNADAGKCGVKHGYIYNVNRKITLR